MILNIPYINEKVQWNNGDLTYIVGANGSGKTLLMEAMMDWCDDMGYTYAHYDAISALSEAKYLIDQATDDDIIYACKMMCKISIDFRDDIAVWAKAGNNHTLEQIGDYMQDHILLRNVLSMAGTGYTRFFVLTMKAILNPAANYYFLDLPETSLHPHLAKQISKYLMAMFPYMKIVITTHSPQILDRMYKEDGSLDMDNIIELPTGYIKEADDHRFNEIFS